MLRLQPEGLGLPVYALTAIEYIRAHLQQHDLPILFCGHYGHMVYGPHYTYVVRPVRYDGGDLALISSLYGEEFRRLRVEPVKRGPSQLARLMVEVRRAVDADRFEWWQLKGTTVCIPVLCGVETETGYVAVAPATSDLPTERFSHVLAAWLKAHPEFARGGLSIRGGP